MDANVFGVLSQPTEVFEVAGEHGPAGLGRASPAEFLSRRVSRQPRRGKFVLFERLVEIVGQIELHPAAPVDGSAARVVDLMDVLH